MSSATTLKTICFTKLIRCLEKAQFFFDDSDLVSQTADFVLQLPLPLLREMYQSQWDKNISSIDFAHPLRALLYVKLFIQIGKKENLFNIEHFFTQLENSK